MDLTALLKYAVDHNASDLHLASGHKPIIRIDGDLYPIAEAEIIKEPALLNMLKGALPEKAFAAISDQNELDLSLEIPDVARFRINIFRQLNGLSVALRVIPFVVQTIEELGLPDILRDVCELPHGLVLLTGPTGTGKSTTLAAMVDYINNTKDCHILTIENPIEYVHQSKKALIQQREVKVHTDSFNDALRAALREDPDVIMVGEMRDLETIRLALTAAETGHLVLATLHTASAPKSIYRIVDVFPEGEKPLVCSMLAESLQVVVAQVLAKKIGGGRIAVQEILICNPAIRNMIRKNEIAQIYTAMQTNQKLGMVTFAQAFDKLISENKIAPEEKKEEWTNVVI